MRERGLMLVLAVGAKGPVCGGVGRHSPCQFGEGQDCGGGHERLASRRRIIGQNIRVVREIVGEPSQRRDPDVALYIP